MRKKVFIGIVGLLFVLAAKVAGAQIEAFDAANVGKRPVFVGFDAIPEALAALPQQKLNATVAQKPKNMGWEAVDMAVKTLRGETLPKEILVDLELVKAK